MRTFMSRSRLRVVLMTITAAALIGAALFGLTDMVSDAGADETCDEVAIVTSKLVELGFQPDELMTEQEGFDLSLPAVNDRGDGAFSHSTLSSKQKLVEFLNGEAGPNAAVRANILAGIPQDEHDRVLGGDGWVGVQFLTPIVAEGNTHYVGGAIADAGRREAAVGDIWWFYVSEGCIVMENLTVRAACANPNVKFPQPLRPVTPAEEPPPPAKQPPKRVKPPVTAAPPTTVKCPPGTGAPNEPACGTPDSGPEQQTHPSDQGPTPGYDEGNAEEVVAEQPQTNETEPTPSGSESTCGTCAPTDPDGGTTEGADDQHSPDGETQDTGTTKDGSAGSPP